MAQLSHQLLGVLSLSALVFGLPAASLAATTATNDTTGSDSTNVASVDQDFSVTVNSSQDANVDNDTNITLNGGGNSASDNTGDASILIDQSEVTTQTATEANVGSSALVLPSIDPGTVTVSNTDTGSGSTNTADATFNSAIDINSVKSSSVTNRVSTATDLGGNEADDNTGDASIVISGVKIRTSISTNANTDDNQPNPQPSPTPGAGGGAGGGGSTNPPTAGGGGDGGTTTTTTTGAGGGTVATTMASVAAPSPSPTPTAMVGGEVTTSLAVAAAPIGQGGGFFPAGQNALPILLAIFFLILGLTSSQSIIRQLKFYLTTPRFQF